MNDDTDKPLNPVGDAALEARITAWVLGEASPFEAAELEEICARDPEARLFERRLRVLHGFIVEDRKAGPDDEWELPAEKRAKIEALFDDAPVVLGEEDGEPEKVAIRYVRKPVEPRETGRRALLALAACTAISAAGWMLFSSVGGSSKGQMAMSPAVNDFVAGGSRVEQQRYVEELRKAVLVQEDAVEDKRKLLSQIERSESMASASDPAARGFTRGLSAAEAHAEVAKEKANLESQLAALDHATATPGTSYGSGWVMPDESLASKVPQLQEEKRQYDALRSQGLAENHPQVKAKAATLEGMEKNVKESVAQVRETLDAKLTLANEELARLDARQKESELDSIKQGIGNQSFADAKNDFKTNQRVLDGLKQQLATEEMHLQAADGDTALAWGGEKDSAPGQRGRIVDEGRPAVGLEFDAPASPAAPPAVAAQPAAAAVDSLAAVEGKSERGQAVDESLAKLGDEVATKRSKSGASGPPARKSQTSEMSLGQGGPMPAKPLTADGAGLPMIQSAGGVPAAGGAIASNELGDRVEFGKNLAFGRDAKPAEMEADTSEQFAMNLNLGRAPANSAFDLQARFRGEAPKESGEARLGGYLYSDGAAEPSFAGVDARYFSKGSLATPGQSRSNEDFIKEIAGVTIPGIPADPTGDVSDVMTAGNRSGLGTVNRNNIDAILNNPDRPAGAAGAADALADNEAMQLQGGFKDFAKAGEMAEAKGDHLDDSIRTNPALTSQHEKNTDEVRRKLYTAEGNYNLGKFDDANKVYEDVLKIDPYNKAARRGMEQVAQARKDYYTAAYDQTRSQLLAEVESSWELQVPPSEQKGLKELQAAAKNAAAPEEVLPRLEKAIRDQEVKLQQDPNSVEVQNQIQLLAKVRDDLRGKVDAKAKEAEKQEQAPTSVALTETLTSAEPFSTFSLHVSDASFKMAKAALDRGEVPAADSIRPEEFYNAFDFGDPAPANGEPVVCAVEQSAHPALPQRNLLRIGVKTGSQGRGGSTPLNLTLLLDSSGSMEREDRNAGLANAVRQLSGLLKEGDTVSVIGFARQPRLLVDRLPGNRAQELNAIFAQTPPEGGTNLEEGLKLGEELALRQFNAAAQNRIVLFTDGAANLGDAKPETLQAKVEQVRQNGIAFDAAGFGTDGLNDKLLERLTRNGNGRYYIVDRAEDADASFAKQLAGAFRPAAENVKVQVRFNPARVAKYKLIGFEEHRLKKEDFRNDAVDAAEMAAEEAGNALYQIEALSQGEGEVGEVSVRFRDVASGQMVERTWTIPYEAQAPAFDQAAPSIQLAGLAAFAAEKLRGAPMADAVDFQQLAPVMAKVKARYSNSKPVAELESMIGKLK